MTPNAAPCPTRRDLFAAAAALGIGSAALQRAVAAQAAGAAAVTPEMVEEAEWVAGVSLAEAERAEVAAGLTRTLREFAALHAVEVGNDVPPAVHFNPVPGLAPSREGRGTVAPTATTGETKRPAADDDLAFLPLARLADLVRTRRVSSVELTKLYLGRLRKYDPTLKFVVTYTEELALKQAAAADAEIAAGRYRGPLHGIPWGAKDLIAVPGYPTTWGAERFKGRVLPATATVAERLERAGAVLVAKLSLGALAWGDVWYGGTTRNPWDPKRGSSGSSAGSAAAVAAGCVGFAVGSETLGSIVSPATECGVTGLRPTFGRVSRHGCMALAWSMDKLGPMARAVEDCALVLGAVHGADGKDASAVDRPFRWPCPRSLKELRVGYAGEPDREEIKALEGLGVKLVPIELPEAPPAAALTSILFVEASAAFDDLARAGKLDGIGAKWPAIFRRARFVPAVEYLRAQRVRTLLMRAMDAAMANVDLYVGGNDLMLANMTGHPTVCVPGGFVKEKGEAERPTATTFTGRPFGESELLAVAAAYQAATGFHARRPPLDR